MKRWLLLVLLVGCDDELPTCKALGCDPACTKPTSANRTGRKDCYCVVDGKQKACTP